MRRKIVAANWKMNLDIMEAAEWLGEVGAQVNDDSCEVLVFPSFVMITDMMDMYQGEHIVFGAQNCSHKDSGAYTGEVSATQLASIGIEYVIIGHSERREYFSETNEMLRQKMEVAINSGLTPVFCCGEPLPVRNENKQKEFVKKQLEETLFGFSGAAVAEMIIAYEPVWAIGTGLNATAEQAQEMHAFIRHEIAGKYSLDIAEQVSIIYGGSCKPANAKELFSCADVDGGLIGGASLSASDFLAIIKVASL